MQLCHCACRSKEETLRAECNHCNVPWSSCHYTHTHAKQMHPFKYKVDPPPPPPSLLGQLRAARCDLSAQWFPSKRRSSPPGQLEAAVRGKIVYEWHFQAIKHPSPFLFSKFTDEFSCGRSSNLTFKPPRLIEAPAAPTSVKQPHVRNKETRSRMWQCSGFYLGGKEGEVLQVLTGPFIVNYSMWRKPFAANKHSIITLMRGIGCCVGTCQREAQLDVSHLIWSLRHIFCCCASFGSVHFFCLTEKKSCWRGC